MQLKPIEVPNDDPEQSDTPCPLGCGYRPTSARDAFMHVCGHVTTNHSTGEDQQSSGK